MWRAWLLIVASAACQRRDAPPSDESAAAKTATSAPAAAGVATAVARSDTLRVPPALPSRPGAGWKELRGEGFTLRYPADALLAPATSHPSGVRGLAIRGPQITLDRGNPEIGAHTGPAYELVISSFPNPAGRSPETWVDSVRRTYNGSGMDDDSLTFVGPPRSIRIAGQRALVLVPFCGDCQPEEVYLVGRRRVVLVSKVYDLSIPGDQRAQSTLYDAILSTFRWDE